MKKTELIPFIFFFASVLLNDVAAQGPMRRVWDYRYGGDNADGTTCFIQANDGGFVIAGYSTSGATGDRTQPSWGSYDYWVIKTDSGGIKQFDFRFGASNDELLTSIIQTSDHGYLLGGFSNSDISGDRTEGTRGSYDYWIVRTDSAGNKIWDKRFGGDDYDELFSMLQTSDGGFMLAGWSASGANGDKTDPSWGGSDYWIVRIDSSGNKLWDKRYGGDQSEELYSMIGMPDGGFILCGTSSSDSIDDKTEHTRGNNDYWLIRIDSIGNKIWDKRFGGSGIDVPADIQNVLGGNFIIGGWSDSPFDGDKTDISNGFQDYWVIKMDAQGNKIWDRDYGGSDAEDGFGNIFQTQDSGFMVTGTSYSGISGDKTEPNLGAEQDWILKTDSMGFIKWDKTILTNGHDETGFTIQSHDGCYEVTVPTNGGIAGFKTQDSRGQNDYWIVKFCDSLMWPIANFSSTNFQICPGTCTDFLNLSQNAVTYEWNFPGGNPSSSNDSTPSTICYATPGTYDVMLITTNYFFTDTLVIPDCITVFPQTAPQSIQQINDTLYSNQGFQTYQWYFNGNIINGATNYFYFVTMEGDYNVVCTDSNGCQLEAAIANVHTGLNRVQLSGVEVFPNPVTDNLVIYNLVQLAPAIKCSDVMISIYNVLGEQVMSVQPHSSSAGNGIEVDVSDLAPGIYSFEVIPLLNIPAGHQPFFKSKFVKE